MILKKIEPKRAINKAYLKLKPNRDEIEKFKSNLIKMLDQIDEKEFEEFHKNIISEFLKSTYYGNTHYINTKGRYDLVIHNGKDANSTVGVIIETKSPKNRNEMISPTNLNAKAFHELILYFLQERLNNKNLEIRFLIATNVYEWFIFDASLFEENFAKNKELVSLFNQYAQRSLSGSTSDFFYKQIADPIISILESTLSFTHFDLRDYDKALRNADKKDDKEFIALYKLLSPVHLLKKTYTNDSNSLDKGFYTELLHLIGLVETKAGNKKLIERQKEGHRNSASLIENALDQLDSLQKIPRLEKPERYGNNEQERLFNIALELAITWVNRILFLKLLEAQLISYHKGDRSYSFLNSATVKNFDDLNSLFFSVLARKTNERKSEVKKLFANVPYLNSSLFEPTDLEHSCFCISQLKDGNLPLLSTTVLKDNSGKKRNGELPILEYFFEFLNAYDFASEGDEEIAEENKTLINASVLGLIFEKINGYKDGSFFTPGFITMYMCRETIRRAVVHKFNDTKGWNCATINDLHQRIEKLTLNEANSIINSLKICDPAVGSGHFLVSALNEIIALKSELQILVDREGKRLKYYQVEVVNDELMITDEDGEFFKYNPKNRESQRVQETLFHEKQAIIENCLFGVDINPNSVKICRLRLWIELLKSAYYKTVDNELETLPNIDINIKCGNSLISRFPLDADIKQALKKSTSTWTIESYRLAVMAYRNAASKEEKWELVKLIEKIKKDFRSEVSRNDKRNIKLMKLKDEYADLTTQGYLFEMSKAEKLNKEKKVSALLADIGKLEKELEEIRSNKIYENAFEWRFEFPEVLNDDGDFVGFDVIIGNPPYVRVDDLEKTNRAFFSNEYLSSSGKYDLYYLFYEKAIKILKKNYFMVFITPNRFTATDSGQMLRKIVSENFEEIRINSVSNLNVFENASTYPAIVFLNNKGQIFTHLFLKESTSRDSLSIFKKEDEFIADNALLFPLLVFPINSKRPILDIYFRISKEAIKLSDILIVQEGFRINAKSESETGDYHIVKQYQFSRYNDIKAGRFIKKELLLKDVSFSSDRYINCQKSKILIAEDGLKIEATIDYTRSICQGGIYFCTLKNSKYSIETLLAFLNSRLYSVLYCNLFSGMHMGGGYLRYRSSFLNELPFIKISDNLNTIFKELVIQILTAKKADPAADTSALEKEIDRLVYELYGLTEEEIKIVEGE